MASICSSMEHKFWQIFDPNICKIIDLAFFYCQMRS